MASKRNSAEQIISKLKEAEVLLSQGRTVDEACRALASAKRPTIAGARPMAE